jgi:hypothetical protein
MEEGESKMLSPFVIWKMEKDGFQDILIPPYKFYGGKSMRFCHCF